MSEREELSAKQASQRLMEAAHAAHEVGKHSIGLNIADVLMRFPGLRAPSPTPEERCTDRPVAQDVQQPTPTALREWAEWFDHPNNPSGVTLLPERSQPPKEDRRYTAGYLLRRIADAMEGR